MTVAFGDHVPAIFSRVAPVNLTVSPAALDTIAEDGCNARAPEHRPYHRISMAHRSRPSCATKDPFLGRSEVKDGNTHNRMRVRRPRDDR
jgi:hypothetical protein